MSEFASARSFSAIGISVVLVTAIGIAGLGLITRLLPLADFTLYASLIAASQVSQAFGASIGDATVARTLEGTSLPRDVAVLAAVLGGTSGTVIGVALTSAELVDVVGGVYVLVATSFLAAVSPALAAARVSIVGQSAESRFEVAQTFAIQAAPIISCMVFGWSFTSAAGGTLLAQLLIAARGLSLARVSPDVVHGTDGLSVRLWSLFRASLPGLQYAASGTASGQAGRVVAARMLGQAEFSAVFLASHVLARITAIISRVERLVLVSLIAESNAVEKWRVSRHLIIASAVLLALGIAFSELGFRIIAPKRIAVPAAAVFSVFLASVPVRIVLAFGRASMISTGESSAFGRTGMWVAIATVGATPALVWWLGYAGVAVASSAATVPAILEHRRHVRFVGAARVPALGGNASLAAAVCVTVALTVYSLWIV